MKSFQPVLLLLGMAVLLGLLTACESRQPVRHSPLEVTVMPRTTPEPSPDAATPLPAGTPQATPAAAPQTRPDCAAAAPDLPLRYEIHAALDWATHRVDVEQQVIYRNDGAAPLRQIVFNVDLNREPDQFALDGISTEDKRPITTYALDEARLAVPLASALAPGCALGLTLRFHLLLPELADGYSYGKAGYHPGYWGFSPRQVNLGLWFPVVAARDAAGEWLLTRFHSVGEQGILEAADFMVELSVTGAPDGLIVAGAGDVSQPDPHTWRFMLSGARDLTLSLSTEFKQISTTTPGGTRVELYYLPDSVAGVPDAPPFALKTAAQAVALFGELYGPYPHPRLVIVEGDFPDGMEFSGLVFVSEAWFRTWQGIPNDWLTLITAHEVAHQWWYALVGSDQGSAPYLDEALATYSELLFLEHTYPDQVPWWWDFRVKLYEPLGDVDASVYEFYSVRAYINAVYLRGALLLDALRQALGDDPFLDWLRRYAAAMRGRVAAPADLWGALSPEEYAATRAVRESYLRQPQVLTVDGDLP